MKPHGVFYHRNGFNKNNIDEPYLSADKSTFILLTEAIKIKVKIFVSECVSHCGISPKNLIYKFSVPLRKIFVNRFL